MPNTPTEQVLVALGRQLRADGYQFVTPTPGTHARVLQRPPTWSDPLRAIFGWSRPFQRETLPLAYQPFLDAPGLFESEGAGLRPLVRFSPLSGLLLSHSSFPTQRHDAVFLGPDTYRFCRAITAVRDRNPDFRPRRVVDLGAGSGAGGLIAAQAFPTVQEVELADINPRALVFCRANAALNGVTNAASLQSDLYSALEGKADLIISNPPYLVDPSHRAYRDGGGEWGDRLALAILEQGLERLAPGGALLLYTGSPIVEGRDIFWHGAQELLAGWQGCAHYEEIDPDVFGEELAAPPYDRADRIATIMLHVTTKDFKS